nr:uncharacterized protein LOC122269883 isoform X1 [Parasteatoda tepidariorum]XP_042900995.1 uncharacterized protein LOC122269883 isoform X2 [Parasteatoda tepidariorum]
MMILWVAGMLLVTLCAAQSNIFPQATVGGGAFIQLPRVPSSGASVSSSAGPSGASASAQVNTPAPYPACLASNPDDAVRSSSPFAYALLEGSFTNPSLRGFYNTSFDTSLIYGAIYDEVKENLSKDRSRRLAGALSFIFQAGLPRITPIQNAVSITNAISEIQGEEAIVITDDKEEYIEPYLTNVSKGVSAADGSSQSQARAVISGLFGYLDSINALTYSKLLEFISILAGEHRLAVYSTCKPSSFEAIPKP